MWLGSPDRGRMLARGLSVLPTHRDDSVVGQLRALHATEALMLPWLTEHLR
jgi:hypothetical protein